jgi:predicted acetyltransferase
MTAVAQEIEPYVRARDLEAVRRIWREVGWASDPHGQEPLDGFLEANNVEVGMLDGEAECAVAWLPGAIRYQDTDLPLCVITAVTTSHVGRKNRFATIMTANALRAGAEGGAAVATLGMFEQGFYDRVGFGTGSYQHQVVIDPSSLMVDNVPYRKPARIGHEDYDEFYELHRRRHRMHGGIVIDREDAMGAELRWLKQPFGLGYRNAEDRLTHAILGEMADEHGPFKVRHIAYEEPAQLLELLRLLRELGDQVSSVKIVEPPELQLQDLIDGPIGRQRTTEASDHATGIRSLAFTQLRILDLSSCITARRWAGPTVECNLLVTDPAADILELDGDHGWNGVGGSYVLRIGDPSTVEPGSDPTLPTLTASINAFSRCWFGVRPSSSLALTDELSAPAGLLGELDDALRLPPPHPGWDY